MEKTKKEIIKSILTQVYDKNDFTDFYFIKSKNNFTNSVIIKIKKVQKKLTEYLNALGVD